MQNTVAAPDVKPGTIYESAKHPGFIIEIIDLELQPDRFFIHAIDRSKNARDDHPILVWQEEWKHCQFTLRDHP